MKPNFQAMTRAELKAYVLEHREDLEALRYFFRVPEGKEVQYYPPICSDDGIIIEENLRFMEKAIEARVKQESSP